MQRENKNKLILACLQVIWSSSDMHSQLYYHYYFGVEQSRHQFQVQTRVNSICLSLCEHQHGVGTTEGLRSVTVDVHRGPLEDLMFPLLVQKVLWLATLMSLWEWNSGVTRRCLWSHLQKLSLWVCGLGQAAGVSWDPDRRKCHIWGLGWPFHCLESPKVFPHLLETLAQGFLIEFWCTWLSRNHTDNQISDQYSMTTNSATLDPP